MKQEGTLIKNLAAGRGCPGACEDCEDYFDCNLPLKKVFQEKGMLAAIKENLKGVKHKVLVLGGKGGVGKSMLAVNLAASLTQKGKSVCILDQVYDCPAIPMMLGVPKDARLTMTDKGMVPYEAMPNIKVVSTGLILDEDEVIVWFNKMKRSATEELLSCTEYGDVDYLVVDIPTGTSAETINALKYLPDTDGALVITVPTEVSQNVARKCIYILRKASVPVIGIVENMSNTHCRTCGEPVATLSTGGGKKMAEEEGERYLDKIPTSYEVSSSLDEGIPFVIKYPNSEETEAIEHITNEVIKFCEASGEK